MNGKLAKNLVVFILVATFMIGLSTTGTQVLIGGNKIDELEAKMEEIQQQMEEAMILYKSQDTEISILHTEILAYNMEIGEYSKVIFSLDNDIQDKEAEIVFTEGKLTETIAEQDEYYKRTKERFKVMYEYGNTEYLEVLLEAKDTSDFFNRLEYINKLAEYDQGVLDDLEEIKNSIVEYENLLNLEKVQLEGMKAENTIALNNVEGSRADKEGKIGEIENNQGMIILQIEEWEKVQEEMDKNIRDLIALYSDNRLFGDGKLDWPTPGYDRITTKFGPRIHPVYGYKSNHTGIDIAAPYGAKIEVSASGKVIFSGWGNAYGNYLLIDHGRDEQKRHIITQYAHCSKLLVREGDLVVRGDIIAEVGSTGWSTGNHLHYGVQFGGNWIDPFEKLY